MSEQREEFEYYATRKFGLNIVTAIVFGVIMGGAAAVALLTPLEGMAFPVAIGGGFFLAVVLSMSPRVASQWEGAVILRLGKFVGLKGPGLFWIVPFIDRPAMWIDRRVRTTGFAAEKTLTADTVPVNVDAVLFWTVVDPEKAALAVADYQEAVAWAAQTALRDIIGKTDLATMLVGREHLDVQIQHLIDARCRDWGIAIHSVEIRDVVIPPALEDAMSRRAQAEREKQARVILGDAEVEIAQKFSAASSMYRDNAVALQLRSFNLLYEGMKERGTLMVVPSGLVDSMNVGGFAGLAALANNKTLAPDGGSE